MISGIIHNNWPKFNVYLVSKTCLLMSFIISSKVLFVVTCFEIIGYWFASLVQLFSTGWIVVELSGNPTQLFYNDSSLMIVRCLSISPFYNCLIVSINEYCKRSSCCQSLAPLTLTNSLSLNTYCSSCWLWMVTTTTTLTNTLLVLGDLGLSIIKVKMLAKS